MTKSTKNTVATPVVLKALHNDIVKAIPNTTLTTKKMRVILRAKLADIHTRNSSWVFNATDYDRARSLFDPAYAAKVAKKAKVVTPRAPRAKKVVEVVTPVEA